jgi:hypothetical protein
MEMIFGTVAVFCGTVYTLHVIQLLSSILRVLCLVNSGCMMAVVDK